MALRELIERSSITDWLLTIFNGLLAFTTIYLVIITGDQRNVMRKDQRAWISPQVLGSQLTVDKPIGADIGFLNSGKTPAKKVEVKMRIEIIDTTNGPTFDYSNTMLIDGFEASLMLPNPRPLPNPVLAIRQIAGTQTAEIINFTQDLSDKYNAGQVWFSIEGKMTYEDVFGAEHWMTFCFANLHNPPSVRRTPEAIKKCTEYNNMDNE